MNPIHICYIIGTTVLSVLAFISGIIFVTNYTCDTDYIEARVKIKQYEVQKIQIQKEIAEAQHKHDQKMTGA